LNSYIVVTLMSKGALNDSESYLGQAIVKVKDYEHELYDKPKQKSGCIEIRDATLIRYVAPVETEDGVSKFSLNSALKVRKVTGTVSFRFRRVEPLRCHSGIMEKVSNSNFSIIKKAAGNAIWKERHFVMIENLLFYNKDAKNPSNENLSHRIDLRTVVNLSFRTDYSPMEIELTSKATASAPEVKWKMRISDDLQALEKWRRRLYYNCEQLMDPEFTHLMSEEALQKRNDMIVLLDGREKERNAMRFRSKTHAILGKSTSKSDGSSSKSNSSSKSAWKNAIFSGSVKANAL